MAERKKDKPAQAGWPLLKLVTAARLAAEQQLRLTPSETLNRVAIKLRISQELLGELAVEQQLVNEVAQELPSYPESIEEAGPPEGPGEPISE